MSSVANSTARWQIYHPEYSKGDITIGPDMCTKLSRELERNRNSFICPFCLWNELTIFTRHLCTNRHSAKICMTILLVMCQEISKNCYSVGSEILLIVLAAQRNWRMTSIRLVMVWGQMRRHLLPS